MVREREKGRDSHGACKRNTGEEAAKRKRKKSST